MIIEVTDGTVIEITAAQVSDFLCLVALAFLFALVCRAWYKEGYRDGRASRKESEATK